MTIITGDSCTNILIIIVGIGLCYFIYKKFFNTNEMFRDHYKEILYFSSKNCGYCGQFQPVWNSFKKTYNNSFNDTNKIEIKQIDADQYPEIVRKFNIDGYPTVIGVYNGEKVTEFNGPRTYENLSKFYIRFQAKY